MIRSNKTAMYIDSIRIYQSNNSSAHVGENHTLGCDPPDYPTKEWIEGHEYRYTRDPPFGIDDKGPLKRQQRGGGKCKRDADCGGDIKTTNLTAVYEEMAATGRKLEAHEAQTEGRGECTLGVRGGMFSSLSNQYVCSCNAGFTGPHCLAQAYFDESPSAKKLRALESPFLRISQLQVPYFMLSFIIAMFTILLAILVARVLEQKKAREPLPEPVRLLPKPVFNSTSESGSPKTDYSTITGRSI